MGRPRERYTPAVDEVASVPVLDIRTYRLVPGGRDELDRIVREGALPMLDRYGIQVVCSGPSLEDDEHYCLVRAFASAPHREEALDSFYGSDEWRSTYREAVLGLIVAYHTVVIPLTPSIGTALTSASARPDA